MGKALVFISVFVAVSQFALCQTTATLGVTITQGEHGRIEVHRGNHFTEWQAKDGEVFTVLSTLLVDESQIGKKKEEKTDLLQLLPLLIACGTTLVTCVLWYKSQKAQRRSSEETRRLQLLNEFRHEMMKTFADIQDWYMKLGFSVGKGKFDQFTNDTILDTLHLIESVFTYQPLAPQLIDSFSGFRKLFFQVNDAMSEASRSLDISRFVYASGTAVSMSFLLEDYQRALIAEILPQIDMGLVIKYQGNQEEYLWLKRNEDGKYEIVVNKEKHPSSRADSKGKTPKMG